MRLTKEFNPQIYTYSNTAKAKGIKNEPTPEQIESLKKLHSLLREIQDRVSVRKGQPIEIEITSGFRSKELNAAIPGASNTSQHSDAEAADTQAIGITHDEYYLFIKALAKAGVITVGQCIKEYGRREDSELDDWIHISIPSPRLRKSNDFMIKRQGKPYSQDPL